AEDGIRDFHVTGVQTCALPIWGVEQTVDILAPEEPALARGASVQRVLDERQARSVEVLELGHREIALLPVDDLRRQQGSCRFLRSEERRVGKEGRAQGAASHKE